MARLRHVVVLGVAAAVYLVAAVNVDGTDTRALVDGEGRWRPPAAADLPDDNALYVEGGRQPGGRVPLHVRATTSTAAFSHRALARGAHRFTIDDGTRWVTNLSAPPDGQRWRRGLHLLGAGADALLWGPDHTRCTAPSPPGWLMIDRAVYDAAGLRAIALRAEQPCHTDVRDYTKRVALRWDRDATGVEPANPRTPPWRVWTPDPAEVPPTDAYLVLTGAPGRGRHAADAITVTEGAPRVFTSPVRHTYQIDWAQVRIVITSPGRLQAGFHGGLRQWGASDNPALGGLSVSAGDDCAASAGWLQVDDVGHTDGGALQRITARMQLRCATGDPVHGMVRWTRAGTTPAAAPVPVGPPTRSVGRGSPPRDVTPACFFVPSTGRFTDVPADDPHAHAIACAADRGLLTGATADRFAPDATLTRAQMAALLARLRTAMGDAPSDAPAATDPYIDIDGLTHGPAIRLLASEGILPVAEDRRYRPSTPATRAELASAVARLLAAGPPPAQALDVFRDDDGAPAERALDMLAARGILDGTTLRAAPDRAVTRAEAATVLARAAAQLVDMGLLDAGG